MYTVEILADSVASAAGLFSRGDKVTGQEYNLRPLVESGAARWLDGPDGEAALQVDESTWKWTAAEATKAIGAATDPILLRRWIVGESRNPAFKPEGRKTVKDAIERRLEELRTDAEAAEKAGE